MWIVMLTATLGPLVIRNRMRTVNLQSEILKENDTWKILGINGHKIRNIF
jgi:hypothetical protein